MANTTEGDTVYVAVTNVNRPEFQRKGIHGEIHKKGCKDLEKYGRSDDRIVEAETLVGAMMSIVDYEDADMGYGTDEIGFMPCIDIGWTKLYAAKQEWKSIVEEILED